MKRTRLIVHYLFAALTLLIIAGGILSLRGLSATNARVDVGVVLGNKVEADGIPAARLAARLDSAYACYQAGECRVIFVSGGVDPEGTDEGQAMRDYLLRLGVSADAIVTDSKGDTTWATAQNLSTYMRENGYTSAAAFTQYFHLERTMLALRRQGISEVSGRSPRYFEVRDVYSILREIPAYAWYYVRPS